jgi:hypothetical protein
MNDGDALAGAHLSGAPLAPIETIRGLQRRATRIFAIDGGQSGSA